MAMLTDPEPEDNNEEFEIGKVLHMPGRGFLVKWEGWYVDGDLEQTWEPLDNIMDY